MRLLVLERERPSNDIKGTVGKFVDLDIYTLELPWLDNKKSISCIPEGEYEMWWGFSPRFKKDYWHIAVPDRRGILIHKGNLLKDTQGCILVGKDYFPKDNEFTLWSSNHAYQQLLAYLMLKKSWRILIRTKGEE